MLEAVPVNSRTFNVRMQSSISTSFVVIEILFLPFLEAYLYFFPEVTYLNIKLANSFAVESYHSRALCVI